MNRRPGRSTDGKWNKRMNYGTDVGHCKQLKEIALYVCVWNMYFVEGARLNGYTVKHNNQLFLKNQIEP